MTISTTRSKARFFELSAACVSASLAISQLASAFAAGPSIESIYPPVGSRATSFSVHVRGSSLTDVAEVLFYRPGVSCQSIEHKNENELVLGFNAEKDCTLESFPFRLRSDQGLSELRTITISPFPISVVEESVDPTPVKHTTTLVGTLDRDDVDTFAVMLSKGERFSAEVHAMRLGGSLLDTKLTLRDPDGRTVLNVDDSPILNQDPCFSIVAEISGSYLVSITSVGGSADANSAYALHLGDFPRPQGCYPLGVQSGTNVAFKLFHSFPGDASTFELSFDAMDRQSGIHHFEVQDQRGICPSAIPIRISQFPNAAPPEVPAMAPCAVHGDISVVEETDTFAFQVTKSGVYNVEVFASRLGSRLDSVMSVSEFHGPEVVSNDDLESHDSRIEFYATAEKTYMLSIRDKRNQGGSLFHYRIEIDEAKPDVAVFLPRRDKLSQSRQTIEVPIGNRVLALIGTKKDYVVSPLDLRLEGLPIGLSYSFAEDRPDTFVRPLVLEASQSSKPMVTLMSFLGHSPSGTREYAERFQQVVDLIAGPADAIFQPAVVNRLAVASIKSIPFSVQIENPALPIVEDATMGVRVSVNRDSDFNQALDITIPHLPAGVDILTPLRIASDADSGILVLRSQSGIEKGVWPLVVEATVSAATSRSPTNVSSSNLSVSPLEYPTVCSSLRRLRVASSPIRGTIEDIAAEQGSSLRVECKIEIDSSIPLPVTAMIEGLPNRVTSAPVLIDGTSKSIVFELKIQSDAPLGVFADLVCRLSSQIDGQPVSYCVARGAKLQVTQSGGAQRDANGKIMSPLEALRKRNASNKNGS